MTKEEFAELQNRHQASGKTLKDYLCELGINYDKKSKTHSCIIEKYAEPEPQQI